MRAPTLWNLSGEARNSRISSSSSTASSSPATSAKVTSGRSWLNSLAREAVNPPIIRDPDIDRMMK